MVWQALRIPEMVQLLRRIFIVSLEVTCKAYFFHVSILHIEESGFVANVTHYFQERASPAHKIIRNHKTKVLLGHVHI